MNSSPSNIPQGLQESKGHNSNYPVTTQSIPQYQSSGSNYPQTSTYPKPMTNQPMQQNGYQPMQQNGFQPNQQNGIQPIQQNGFQQINGNQKPEQNYPISNYSQNAPQSYSTTQYPANTFNQSTIGYQGFTQQTAPQQEITTTQISTGAHIKGESRIEYVPYEREVTEYITQEVVEYVPIERKVTDYYAVQYDVEYIPQVIQEKYMEYVPVEQVRERVEYQAVERQTVIHTPSNEFTTGQIQYQPSYTSSQVQSYQPPVSQQTYQPQQSHLAQQSHITQSTYQTQYQPQVVTQGFYQNTAYPNQTVLSSSKVTQQYNQQPIGYNPQQGYMPPQNYGQAPPTNFGNQQGPQPLTTAQFNDPRQSHLNKQPTPSIYLNQQGPPK